MTSPGRPVEVRYLKHPATLHWQHRMRVLGEDEWGLWLGAGDGRLVRKGDTEWGDVGRDFVQVVVPGAWWTAMFNEAGFPIEGYADVVTPAVWHGDALVTMVDLDLDVVRTADGDVLVVDQEEFLLHQRVLGYAPEWVERAPAVATEVAGLFREPSPLCAAGRRWLAAQRDVAAGAENASQ